MNNEEKQTKLNTYPSRSKEAAARQNKQYYEKNKEYCIAGVSRWQKENPEKKLSYCKKYRDRYPDRRLNTNLKCTYGITLDQYTTILNAQNGVCAICNQPETKMKRGVLLKLSVDHDHGCCPDRKSCGKCVRGLLCGLCNSHLSVLENTEFVDKANRYLKK